MLRKDSRPYKIFKAAALAGGLLALSAVSPYGGAKIAQGLLSAYIGKKRFERERFLRDLKRLQSRKIASYKELSDGHIEIVLMRQGELLALRYKFYDLKLDTQHWDGRWRLVMFDIPHHRRKARDAFRAKLCKLHFYQIQKSAYIVPYTCEDEIDFICAVFRIRRYVLVFHLDHFEGEEKLRHHFKLSSI